MSEKVILMQDGSVFQDLLKQGQMMETEIREMSLGSLVRILSGKLQNSRNVFVHGKTNFSYVLTVC
jgi:hypothetical protein